jgi:hypothetical protein
MLSHAFAELLVPHVSRSNIDRVLAQRQSNPLSISALARAGAACYQYYLFH